VIETRLVEAISLVTGAEFIISVIQCKQNLHISLDSGAGAV
jgi:hypothetical protein